MLVVEKGAVGEAVQHGALEAELGGAFELVAAASGTAVGNAAKAAKRRGLAATT
ncbi:MAG TPA: hypothetical protein VEK31_11950 [Xanthobacteraceae bacterium]|nr:hypothetical protein [Xanthobacteraceae bacterium]